MRRADMTAAMTAIPLRARTATAIALASASGVVAFGWPFLAQPGSGTVGHAADAPVVFALVVPLLLLVAVSAITDGGIDAKALAMLGVLSAVGAALRPLGSGVAGIEPVWVVIILGGRALGPAFGFVLGATTLGVSAALTGGVGPWLPFQMLAAAWVGLGAGLLPRRSGRALEPLMLASYAVVAALAFGMLMNLWLWPWTPGLGEQVSYVPGSSVIDNARRWISFSILTSLGWDISRAVTTAALIVLAHRPVLAALRRGARRARFDARPEFAPHVTADTDTAVDVDVDARNEADRVRRP